MDQEIRKGLGAGIELSLPESNLRQLFLIRSSSPTSISLLLCVLAKGESLLTEETG
jgi:hypothetical protein